MSIITRTIFSPWVIAVSYGMLSTLIVAVLSVYEGSFWNEKTFLVDGTAIFQHPYRYNFSTILDFAILNPIAIYFIFRAKILYARSYAHFKKGGDITPYHKVGLSILSFAVGVSAMWFYFEGFVGGNFYTETFAPTHSGEAIISMTGWAIFVATALIIALLFYASAEFVNYVHFLLKLKHTDFKFRLPPAISNDFKIAIAPCIDVAYILTTLFAVLILFIFRDFFQFNIENSNRVWLLGPYILICIVVFLPFAHLHRLMAKHRDRLIEAGNELIEGKMGFQNNDRKEQMKFDASKLLGSIDHIQKLQSFYASVPVWPTKMSGVLLPNISFIISVLTLLYKTIDTFKHAAQ